MLFIWAAEYLIFRAAIFVDWAAKLGSRFLFFLAAKLFFSGS
jgi:hypothetical protein